MEFMSDANTLDGFYKKIFFRALYKKGELYLDTRDNRIFQLINNEGPTGWFYTLSYSYELSPLDKSYNNGWSRREAAVNVVKHYKKPSETELLLYG